MTLTESADLRGKLQQLLQETDPHRQLDSLESVVVLTYLANQLAAPDGPAPDGPAQDRPKTIEGWVAWAAKHSFDS